MRRALAVLCLLLLAGASLAAVAAISIVERAGSPVGRPTVTRAFSPNGDGRLDVAHVRFDVSELDAARIEIRDAHGDVVHAVRRRSVQGPVSVTWDGRLPSGERAREGRYSVRIRLVRLRRTFDVRTGIHLDVTPPPIEQAAVDLTLNYRHVLRVFVASRASSRREVLLDGRVLPLRAERRTREMQRQRSFAEVLLYVLPPRDFTARDAPRLRVRVSDAAGNATVARPRLVAKTPGPARP